jgi:hypothetical protein
MNLKAIIFSVVLILGAGPMANADNIDAALAKLENFKPGDGSPALDESLAAIRAGMATGDTQIWKRLRAIIENPKIPLRVRTEVLRVGFEKADKPIADDMLTLFDVWGNQLPIPSNSGETRMPETDADGRVTLLGYFVNNLENDAWRRWIGSDPKTLGLLERVIVRTSPGMNLNRDALASFASGNASREARRAVAERIVEARPSTTEPDAKLLELLDASSCEKLRALVRRTDDPDRFHFGAAAALGHLGDKAIQADFESRLPAFEKKDRNTGGILRYYLWQIDVQGSPDRLLDYVAAAPQHDIEKRKWAVRRGVQLGLEKTKIRDAILKHASLVQPNTKTGVQEGLSSLKTLCIELKILDQNDLPGVRVAQGNPTP